MLITALCYKVQTLVLTNNEKKKARDKVVQTLGHNVPGQLATRAPVAKVGAVRSY